jgi:hypothetical protein
MKTRHKLIAAAVAALLVAAGVAIAQIPTLFVTTLTGNEQVNVIVPATGTLTTNPQTQATTINTIKSFVAATSNGVNNQIGTSYTIAATDCGKLVTFNNSGAIAVTLPQATGAFATCQFSTQDIGTGAATITPTTSTIDGAATLVLNQNRGTQIFSDGTNWQIEAGAVGLQVTPAAIAEGGTGSATAATARTALAVPGLASNNTLTGTNTFSSQIISTAGLPTIASGACGATTNGAVVAGSTNQTGNITIASATTTTCTVSFSATLAVAPQACVIFPTNATAAATGTTVARVSSVTTSQFVITGSALASANYEYICL